jgi:hypothetical protein
MHKEVGEARKQIVGDLRERRGEIERLIATRVFAIFESPETTDPEYIEGLRSSLGAALEFAFQAVQRGEQRAPDVPTLLLAQARMAARNGVSLDTVLRRYFAGYSLLLELILEEAGIAHVSATALRPVLRGHAAVFDRLVEAVSEEHRREAAVLLRSTPERRADRVRRLLAGEPIDAEDLGYDLDCFHLGLAGAGQDIAHAVRALAAPTAVSTLTIPLSQARTWAWLGSRRPFKRDDLTHLLDRAMIEVAADATLAFGEPCEGPDGWRLTHRQAVAVLPIAGRMGRNVVCYADAGLLASVRADGLLLESLQRTYLAPLSRGRDGGKALRQTLRAYLRIGRNITSAAAALGVNRETVRKRLQVAEEQIGRSLDECAAEVEVALRLTEHLDPKSSFRLSDTQPPPNRPVI